MLKLLRKNLGFSILEIVVASGLVTVGLIGLASLVIYNIQAFSINRDNLIAAQLAKEGIELVRNIRDTNWRDSTKTWKEDIVSDGTYTIYYDNPRSTINSSANSVDDAAARLYINVNGFYQHGSGTPTQFFRLISITEDTNDYITVLAHVRWSNRGQIHNYQVSTRLYDWR